MMCHVRLSRWSAEQDLLSCEVDDSDVVSLDMFIAFSVDARQDDSTEHGPAGSIAEGTMSDTPQAKPLSQAGDICDSCAKFWRHQKIQPKRLVHVFDAEGNIMKTDNGTEIVVCPHCDGDLILKLPKGE